MSCSANPTITDTIPNPAIIEVTFIPRIVNSFSNRNIIMIYFEIFTINFLIV